MASDKWLQPPLTMTEELPTQSATASVYRQRGRGEGSTEERDRESSLEGGVKVLDNCSTKCCCWALWLQSGGNEDVLVLEMNAFNRHQSSRNLYHCSFVHYLKPEKILCIHHILASMRGNKCTATICSVGMTDNCMRIMHWTVWVFFKCVFRHETK